MLSMTKKLVATLAVGAFLALSVSTSAHASAPNPDVDYEFENTTNDSGSASTFTVSPACPADPCNTSTGFGTSNGDKYWEWASTANRGGGFTIDTQQALTGTYTMMLKFSFTDPNKYSSWRKIIDFQNRADDTGFYLNSGRIRQYPLGSNGPTTFPVNTDITLMVTRDASTKQFTVFTFDGTNFVQEIQVTDTNDRAVPVASSLHQGGTKLGFFFDDTATSAEATSTGKVYFIRLWEGQALSQADLQSQANTAVLSAPSSNQSVLTLTSTLAVGDLVPSAPVTLSGSDLQPNSAWRAEMHSTPVTFASGTTDGSGNFTNNATLPASLTPGKHVVTLYGTASNGSTWTRVMYITVGADMRATYVSSSQEETLSNTGQDQAGLLRGASALILLGTICFAGVQLVRRRSRV